jgi:hypothetical protein
MSFGQNLCPPAPPSHRKLSLADIQEAARIGELLTSEYANEYSQDSPGVALALLEPLEQDKLTHIFKQIMSNGNDTEQCHLTSESPALLVQLEPESLRDGLYLCSNSWTT